MRAVIAGGGISGLAASYELRKAGAQSLVIESNPQLGGVIRTERIEGNVLECGPDSFISTKPAALELIRELGLADDVIGSNDDKLVYFELGTEKQPPRSVLGGAAAEKTEEISKIVGETATAWLVGERVLDGKLQIEGNHD